jgi:hypothetical protein
LAIDGVDRRERNAANYDRRLCTTSVLISGSYILVAPSAVPKSKVHGLGAVISTYNFLPRGLHAGFDIDRVGVAI